MLAIIKRLLIVFGLVSISLPAVALTDLVQVYQQALKSDPTFQKASAQYRADIEKTPQAIAVLLPQIIAGGNHQGNETNNFTKNNSSLSRGKHHFASTDYGLTLSQTVFDLGQFSAVSAAKADVKAAVATFNAAQQNLIQRVARAYFRVLDAQDTLRYDLAGKRANYRQLDQEQEKYRVGISTITGVYNAKANYDASVAQVIADKNAVQDAREDLRAITNVYYTDLAPLRKRLPLVRPTPANITAWVDRAKQQNFDLQATRYTTKAASANVTQAHAGHFPTVTVDASSIRNRNSLGGIQSVNELDSSIGVTINLPIFQGGLVASQTRQAIAQYHVAIAEEQQQYRQTVNDTRQNYNNVIAGISKINADRQFIRSAQGSLKTNEESFKVGTRTIIDVLDSVATLTQAQQQHAQDQYNYLLVTIALKQAAGTLSLADLQGINRLLVHSEAAAKKAASPEDDAHKHASMPQPTSQKAPRSQPKPNKPNTVTNKQPARQQPTPKTKSSLRKQSATVSKPTKPPLPKLAINSTPMLEQHTLL